MTLDLWGLSLTDIFFLGCFWFGVGYAIGNAKRFGFFKFLIALLALFPFYSSFLQTQNQLVLATGSFFGGLTVVFLSGREGFSFEFPFRLFFWNLLARRGLREDASEGRQPEEFRGPRSGPRGGGGGSKTASETDERQARREEADAMRQKAKAQKARSEGKSDRGAGASGSQSDKGKAESGKESIIETETDNRTPYEILGLQSGASHEEIVKAYRDRVKALHPDRWALMPPHLRKQMEEEMKKINGAYGKLK